jgi:hypothetical protein
MTTELSRSKNAFTDASEFVDQNMNLGLILKKDQGFQFLSIEDKAFLLCHLYSENKDKVESYCESVLDVDFKSLTPEEKSKTKLVANNRWKWIEQKMGGFRNIISMMGIDVVMIVQHAQRLLKADKMALDKNGVEHYSMDGQTQMKALEFLAKLSGNYAEDVNDQQKTSININFNGANPKPARPVDIEDDNMEIFVGDPSKLDKD